LIFAIARKCILTPAERSLRMRVLSILLLLPAVALAQQGAKPAAGLISEKVLPLDMAVDIARAAVEKCRADGYRTTVAIVDAGGNPEAVGARRRHQPPHGGSGAEEGLHRADLSPRVDGDGQAVATQVPPPSIDGTIALGGGFPIRAGDQVVGAIGVSGAPGQDKDEACANAGPGGDRRAAEVDARACGPSGPRYASRLPDGGPRPSPSRRQATPQPPIAGTWKLNAEKSGVQVPPDYVEIRQYRLRADGYLVGLLFTGNARGLRYLQFTAKSDGKDYPEHSDQIVADMIAAGTPTPRTYAETKIDEYTTAWIDKVNGKITAQGRRSSRRTDRR
jgi:uncharacterized protein GlcG (DUF336 family)